MDIRYTLHGSAMKDEIAALREEIAALKATARVKATAEVSPETARVAEIGMTAARAEKAAQHADGFYCARHDHGFAFRMKKNAAGEWLCKRDGQPA